MEAMYFIHHVCIVMHQNQQFKASKKTPETAAESNSVQKQFQFLQKGNQRKCAVIPKLRLQYRHVANSLMYK